MSLDAIRSFRVVRKFKDQPVPADVMLEILNAGRRSQSSKNTQPWQFVVVRDRDTLKQLSECGTYAGHLAGAAFGVALIAPKGTDYDQGQATAYMQLAAWELGVGSCIASMWEPDRARAILGVPAEMDFDVALSFGYPAEERDPTLKRGGRRPLEEIVHWEKW